MGRLYFRARALSSSTCSTLSRVARLTPRERKVFELVVRGRLNKQIAHELGASERTIKAHRRKVMEKCEVKSLAELVIIAERMGIVPTSEHGDPAVPKMKAGE